MSKAERRQRARQRAKARARQVPEREITESAAPVAAAQVQSAAPQPQAPVPPPPLTVLSARARGDFITGPIVRQVAPQAALPTPAPRRTARLEVPKATVELEESAEEELLEGDDQGDDDQEDGDEDTDDQEEDEDGGDLIAGDDDDDEEDEQEEAELDALYNLACGSIEQGDALTWSEIIQSLFAAEIEDPRLAFITALLLSLNEEESLPAVTGDRVLEVMVDLKMEDIVDEAREDASPGKPKATAEERAIVRTTSSELAGKQHPSVQKRRPLRASDVRSHRTALGLSVPVPEAPVASSTEEGASS